MKLAPSILSADFMHLANDIKKCETGGAELLHVDVMDGVFVNNITFGPDMVKSIHAVTTLLLDVHLMIKSPERYIENFVEAGADYLTIHLESTDQSLATLKKIRSLGVKAGLSIKPNTPLDQALPFLPFIDLLLIMSVEPGFGGQGFIPESFDKIKIAKAEIIKYNHPILLEVDGGVNIDNICQITQVGAEAIVAGSAVFKDGMIENNIQNLIQACN